MIFFLSREINRRFSFGTQKGTFVRSIMRNVRGKRISIPRLISILRALHTMMAFNGRFRFCLHTLRTMTLTGRKSRRTIATRAKMTNRRRITRVRQICSTTISKVRRNRRAIRLLRNINRRRQLRIIAMLRSIASTQDSNVSIFRCKNVFSTGRIVASFNLCVLANRRINGILYLLRINATSNRMNRATRHGLFNVTQSARSYGILVERVVRLVRRLQTGRILIKRSAFSNHSSRFITRANLRLLRITFRVE